MDGSVPDRTPPVPDAGPFLVTLQASSLMVNDKHYRFGEKYCVASVTSCCLLVISGSVYRATALSAGRQTARSRTNHDRTQRPNVPD